MNIAMHHTFGEKTGKLALVAGLHVALVFGLIQGMQVFHTPAPPENNGVYFPPEPLKPVEPPPQPQPPAGRLSDPVIHPFPIPNEFTTKETITISDTPPLHTPCRPGECEKTGTGDAVGKSDTVIQPKPAGKTSPPVVDMQSCTKPVYPLASVRNGETGTVTLSMLIAPNGQVSDTRVDQSSGYKALDKAARSALSACHFQPAMRDGVAESAWVQIQYVWKLDDNGG